MASDYTHINSPFVSKYYKWFCEMGYPQLDIAEHEDGSWSIIEMLNSPVVPSLTRWHTVLKNIRNTEPSIGFVKKYIAQCDPRNRAMWDKEESKTSKMEQEQDALERHRHDLASRAAESIVRNEALVDRIAKNGMQEANLERIAAHIPKYELDQLRDTKS